MGSLSLQEDTEKPGFPPPLEKGTQKSAVHVRLQTQEERDPPETGEGRAAHFPVGDHSGAVLGS